MSRRADSLIGKEEKKCELTGLLRHLPLQDPPCDLSARVLERIKAGRSEPLWRRLIDWMRTPRVVTIRPLTAVSTAAALLLILAAGYVAQIAPRSPSVRTGNGALVPVVLDLAYPNAARVAVIGSFNGWKPEGYEMQARAGAGRWVIEIKIPAGAYEYAFLVDGHMVVADPGATFYKRDGFGSRNAVLYAGFNGENTF
jgi:hypothetical protein